MELRAKIETPATIYPVTLAELKQQLKLTGVTTDDDLLNALIATASRWAEDYTGRVFLPSTIEVRADMLNPNNRKPIALPYGPVISLTKIEYYPSDDSDTLTEIDAEYYSIDNTGLTAELHLDEYFETNTAERWDAYTITYQSGFADAASVPKPIWQAILMKAARLYTHPDDGVNERFTISESLLSSYCIPRL